MIRIYCRSHHKETSSGCNTCDELDRYATQRLQNCTFQDNKPTCGNCPIHCYRPQMRKEIVDVMKFSGPRMIFYHPYLAIRHLLDGRHTVQKLTRAEPDKSIHKGEPRT